VSSTVHVAPLTFPSPQTFVDSAVRVFSCLSRSELLLHARHPCTERIPAAATLRLRSLKVHALFLGGCATLGVKAAIRVLAFLACPCGRLSHFRDHPNPA